MTPTAVLLADLPTMLEDILFHLLTAQTQVDVIRGSGNTRGLAAAAAAVHASLVVVMRAQPAKLQAVDPTLAQAAAVAVLALSADGSWGCMHRLRLESTRYDEVASAQLAEILAALPPAE